MNTIKTLIIFFIISAVTSCAQYKIDERTNFYSSKGFALIYEDSLYNDKIINKKIKNDKFVVLHSHLKKNSLIKIINPINEKEVEVVIQKNASYPKIFNIVLSNKIATFLELDLNNPYVEIYELKKNIKFIARESNTFDEEKKVAEKAPLNKVIMTDLSLKKTEVNVDSNNNKNFFILISDFYYEETANNLKRKLTKETNLTRYTVKKIKSNKFRLFVGPFSDFNSLKSIYISLNNLGFEDLNIYKE